MMFTNNQMYELLELLGLEAILEQNDIEQVDVLELLVRQGMIDPEDYLFSDIEEELEE